MLERLKPIMTRPLLLSLGAALAGIVVFIIAEMVPVHELRLVGASLVAGGGTGIGIYTGLADPRMLRIPAVLRDWRVALGALAALLMVAPVLAVLIAALVGLTANTAQARDGGALALGALVSILMLFGTTAITVASVRAIIRAGTEQPRPSGNVAETEA